MKSIIIKASSHLWESKQIIMIQPNSSGRKQQKYMSYYAYDLNYLRHITPIKQIQSQEWRMKLDTANDPRITPQAGATMEWLDTMRKIKTTEEWKQDQTVRTWSTFAPFTDACWSHNRSRFQSGNQLLGEILNFIPITYIREKTLQ